MKIQSKKTETITREIEIELPAFRKSDNVAYKVVTETEAIQVWYSEFIKPEISIVSPSTAYSGKEEDCTEEEFNKIFDEVLSRITTLKELNEIELIHNDR